MICNDHLCEIDPRIFNLKILEAKYEEIQDQFKTYEDPRGKHTGFNLKRVQDDFPYAQELCDKIKIQCRPRYYTLDPGTLLVPHVDYGTACSINVLLYDKDPAAINVEGSEYLYKACVLNVQKEHSVQNGSIKRILFKLTIMDQSYEEVCRLVKRYWSVHENNDN